MVVACNMNSLTKKPYVDEYDSSREGRKMHRRKNIEKGEGGWWGDGIGYGGKMWGIKVLKMIIGGLVVVSFLGSCFFCFVGFWLGKKLANYRNATSKFLIYTSIFWGIGAVGGGGSKGVGT